MEILIEAMVYFSILTVLYILNRIPTLKKENLHRLLLVLTFMIFLNMFMFLKFYLVMIASYLYYALYRGLRQDTFHYNCSEAKCETL